MTPRGPSAVHRRPLPKYGARLAPGLCSCPGGMSWLGCVARQPFLMRVTAGAVEVAEARAVDLPAGCAPPPQPAVAATTTRAARTRDPNTTWLTPGCSSRRCRDGMACL